MVWYNGKKGVILVEITNIKTIKLELDEDREIYIMYEKPEEHKYECKIYVGKKDFGNLAFHVGFPVPLEHNIGIRVDSDEHYEEDIVKMVMLNVEQETIKWDKKFFKQKRIKG